MLSFRENLLSFLKLWVYSFHQLWQHFGCCFFKFFLSSSPPSGSQMLDHLILSQDQRSFFLVFFLCVYCVIDSFNWCFQIHWSFPLYALQACTLSLVSHVQLFVAPWTAAHEAPLSMGFSRQEYWSGLPCPPLGGLPDPGVKSRYLVSLALAGGFFTPSTTWEASSVGSNLLLISAVFFFISGTVRLPSLISLPSRGRPCHLFPVPENLQLHVFGLIF